MRLSERLTELNRLTHAVDVGFAAELWTGFSYGAGALKSSAKFYPDSILDWPLFSAKFSTETSEWLE